MAVLEDRIFSLKTRDTAVSLKVLTLGTIVLLCSSVFLSTSGVSQNI